MATSSADSGDNLPYPFRMQQTANDGQNVANGRFSDAERASWADLMGNAPASVKKELDVAMRPVKGHLMCRATVLDHLLLNRVIGLHHSTNLQPQDIDECLAFFREAGIDRFFVQLPIDDPYENIRQWLRERGLVQYKRRWVAYERDAQPIEVPSCDFSVKDASEEHLERLGSLLCHAFDCKAEASKLFTSLVGRPGWTVKVAVDGEGQLMGVGMMFVQGSSASLNFGATDPAFRRRGVQRVLMATRIAEALERGCNHLSTETGEEVPGEPNPSGNNMLSCGFRPVLTTDNWTLPGTTWLP